jgi:hypothetical protein
MGGDLFSYCYHVAWTCGFERGFKRGGPGFDLLGLVWPGSALLPCLEAAWELLGSWLKLSAGRLVCRLALHISDYVSTRPLPGGSTVLECKVAALPLSVGRAGAQAVRVTGTVSVSCCESVVWLLLGGCWVLCGRRNNTATSVSAVWNVYMTGRPPRCTLFLLLHGRRGCGYEWVPPCCRECLLQ